MYALFGKFADGDCVEGSLYIEENGKSYSHGQNKLPAKKCFEVAAHR